MKKTTILLIILFCNILLSCHVSHVKELYADDDLNYISKTEFEKKPDHRLGYNLRFDLDSCFLNVKVSRYKRGRIKLKLLDSIKKSFSRVYPNKINENEILLINYYPGQDRCSSTGYKESFKRRYNQLYPEFKKIENLTQLFIYESIDGLKGFGKKIDWQSDKKDLIKNTFYPIHYPCGGYVIINSKGYYLSERGEYGYWEGIIKEIKQVANYK